jgi:C6 transcription factor Pro1
LHGKTPREGLRDGIEVLACIVQLIMLEVSLLRLEPRCDMAHALTQVSKGDVDNWQKHLLAAPDLHVFLRTYCIPQLLLSNPGTFSRFHNSSSPSDDSSSLSFVDHAAMEFFSGVIIWFDILGSASMGLRPQYADICAAALGDQDSKVQLQDLMGCENWAMTTIREIAVLEDWKRQMEKDSVFSVRELVRRAGSIEQRLEAGVAAVIERLSQYSSHRGLGKKNLSDTSSTSLVVSSITQTFACASRVYLNVLISGPNPNLPEMRESVSRTLAGLNALPDPQLIRNVVWSFCIAGCMAARDQEQSFKDLASAARIDQYTFGTAWKALEVMETCWMMRRLPGTEQNDCDWFSAMKTLGSHVILV